MSEETKIKQTPKLSKSQFELVEDYLSTFYDFRYNEISNEVENCKVAETEFKPLNENNLYRDLQHARLKFSQANLSALLRSDFVPIFNPFKEYFENLPEWQKDTDYIETLANYVTASDQKRFNYHFKKMLVRVIACALINDVFNKQAFVLVSYAQNTGKSTFCRFLCPQGLADYITEVFSPDKDGQISLAENLFINLDELASLSKYETNQLKSSFSKDKIKIRRPFEKKATTSPRRASFLGSTNKAEFLTDETGSVRWLCFEISKIDFDYSKKVNLENVWAQAYALYIGGFKYNITADDVKENDTENRKFQKITPEAELIGKMYEPGTSIDIFSTPYQISVILNTENNSTYKFTPENVGRALVFLGFERATKRIEGSNPAYGYYIKHKIEKQLTTATTNEGNAQPL